MKKVADLMSLDVHTLSSEHLAYHALIKMQENQLRHIPVVDEMGELLGIVSDRDLKQQLQNSFDREDIRSTDMEWMLKPLSELMTRNPVTVRPSDPVLEAVVMMLRHKISSVVVVPLDSNKPAGILTETDLLRLLSQFLEGEYEIASTSKKA